MADGVDKAKEHKELLRALPMDDSPEQIDALWRQIMVYKTFADGRLNDARERRSQAETVREKAEQEAADATRRLCDDLRQEADRALGEAERLKTETANLLSEAQAERDAKRVVSEAREKAQELLDQARLAAQQESTDLRRQALKEIRGVLGRIETVRAAADEELETQRIFSNVAKLKASTTPSILGYVAHGNGSSTESMPVGVAADAVGEGTSVAATPRPESPKADGSQGAAPETPDAARKGGGPGKAQDKRKRS